MSMEAKGGGSSPSANLLSSFVVGLISLTVRPLGPLVLLISSNTARNLRVENFTLQPLKFTMYATTAVIPSDPNAA